MEVCIYRKHLRVNTGYEICSLVTLMFAATHNLLAKNTAVFQNSAVVVFEALEKSSYLLDTGGSQGHKVSSKGNTVRHCVFGNISG